MQAHRYAIYLAPADPFRTFGAQWLGRDADTGNPVPMPAGIASRPDEWVKAPAHYALHATLKPPFRLAEGTDASMLDAATRAFARDRTAFDAPLTLRALRGFIAWCLDDAQAPGGSRMHALADDCMRAFDRFRAPASPEEFSRRRPDQLTAAQRAMLDAWGYPYAFDTFTFHITLTGMLDAASESAAFAQLSAVGGRLLESPLHVDAICVFVQPEPGADFVIARHYRFDGTTIDGAGAPYLQA